MSGEFRSRVHACMRSVPAADLGRDFGWESFGWESFGWSLSLPRPLVGNMCGGVAARSLSALCEWIIGGSLSCSGVSSAQLVLPAWLVSVDRASLQRYIVLFSLI